MLLDILTVPNPILSAIAEPIHPEDDYTELAADMCETMLSDGGGAGLAAPQVGQSVRIIVVDLTVDHLGRLLHPRALGGEPLVLANPKIIQRSDETAFDSEGCLSVPRVNASVQRSTSIRLEALRLTPDGWQPNEDERFFIAEGFAARLIEHEVDHLDGKTIDAGFTRQQRRRYERGQAKKETKTKHARETASA
jgi:peptide deformylase